MAIKKKVVMGQLGVHMLWDGIQFGDMPASVKVGNESNVAVTNTVTIYPTMEVCSFFFVLSTLNEKLSSFSSHSGKQKRGRPDIRF